MKKLTPLLLASVLLCGCVKGNAPDGDNFSDTSPAPENTSAAVSETEAANAETASVTEKPEAEQEPLPAEDDLASLESFILESAKYGNSSNDTVIPLIYDDLNDDGRKELIALYGNQRDKASGYLWYANENKAVRLNSVGYVVFSGMADDIIEMKNIDGHTLMIIKQTSLGYTGDDYHYSYLYDISDGSLRELDISGKFGRITDLGDGNFEAVKFDYDAASGNSKLTWKNYWLYYENGSFKEYVGEKITKADLMYYVGGKDVLNAISAMGGEVTDILYRQNEVVNVNYTVTEEDGITYNKFYAFYVKNWTYSEIEAFYEENTNNYGTYLPSVLEPETGLPDEQIALYRLIEKTAAGSGVTSLFWDDPSQNYNGYTIAYPLFGDFDGDGKNELIALYKKPSQYNDLLDLFRYGEIWFASGERAERLTMDGSWFPPEIVTSMGRTFLKTEDNDHMFSTSYYYLIKDSSPMLHTEITRGNGDVYPDGKHGDLTAVKGMRDFYSEYDADGNFISDADPSWKTYWFYSMGEISGEYRAVEISRDEFLKYDGAAEILDEIEAEGYELRNILKRGNGIINISYFAARQNTTADTGSTRDNMNKTLKYRNGKVTDITEANSYYDKGYYAADETDESVPDFEIFSGMIYDTAEGDENSALLDRFYGDIDGDGKNELYAYYGTEESFELWFADENGAEKSDKPYELMTIDGDVLMKKPRSEENTEDNTDSEIYDYYIIRNGKAVPVDASGADNISRNEDGVFSGYITAADAVSNSSEETVKEYWFYYRDGKFNDYPGDLISEEDFLEYDGARAFLDEIASMGGGITDIFLRSNGIININYDADMLNDTLHYYLTLKIDDKGRVKDITPRNWDGTLNNKGYYFQKLS